MPFSKVMRALLALTFTVFIFTVATAAPNPKIVREDVLLKPETPNIAPRALIPLNPRPSPSPVTPTPGAFPSNFPHQYALENGWTIAIRTFSYTYPVSSSARYLEHLFTTIQAYALARMLQNLHAPCQLRMEIGEIRFAMAMQPGSTLKHLDWAVVYGFARYMLRWVQNGFSGQGGLVFRHRSGILVGAYLIDKNAPSEAIAVATPDSC